MEEVVCSCLKCHSWIGKFENLWDRIGKTYYSPICTASDLGGLVTVGEVREAAKTGVIENSFLQDLACKGCGEKLGLRCDNAPISHILVKDQLILRIGGMTIVSEDTGQQALLRVRRKFSLTGPQSPSVNRQEGREQPISLVGNGVDFENNPQQLNSKTAPLSNDSDPLSGLMRFAEWAEEAISGQRKDIGRISTVVSKMEKDMRSFRDFMIETRRDIATVPGGKPWASVKRSVTLLEDEVGSIRAELEARPCVAYSNDDGVKLSADELDVLTSSITKISQKVNEVESLKMELQFMKTRLKRFEEASRSVKEAVEPSIKEIGPAPQLNSTSNITRLAHSVRRVVEPRTTESLTKPPPDPNSNRETVQGIVRGASTEWDYTKTPMNKTSQRKRTSEEYEGDPALEIMDASAVNSQKKGKSLDPTFVDPHHKSYWKINHKPKPSRLSNVQHVDEIPDPHNQDLYIFAEKFTDGNYSSEGDHHPLASIKEREYDSAPESRPARRKAQPSRQSSNIRDSTTPEEISPPRKGSRLQALQRKKKSPRQRAYSVGLRNADGVRLTKNGTPDRRTGNYKYLKQYREKMKLQKEQEQEQEQEHARASGKASNEGGGGMNIVPSIEAEVPDVAAQMQEQEEATRLEVAKQAELEARDRLVSETLERELGA